jgi:hypothetical protein
MRLIILATAVVATIAAAITAAAIALLTTERGRAVTASVAERYEPQISDVRSAIDPGVQQATKVLRRIPIVSDQLDARSSTTDTIAAAASDAADTIAEAASDAADTASETISDTAEAIGDTVAEATAG